MEVGSGGGGLMILQSDCGGHYFFRRKKTLLSRDRGKVNRGGTLGEAAACNWGKKAAGGLGLRKGSGGKKAKTKKGTREIIK